MSPESFFQVCLEEWSVCWQQSICAHEQGALGKHLDTWGKTNVLQQGTIYSPGAGSSCLVALIVDVLGGHHSNTKMVNKMLLFAWNMERGPYDTLDKNPTSPPGLPVCMVQYSLGSSLYQPYFTLSLRSATKGTLIIFSSLYGNNIRCSYFNIK